MHDSITKGRFPIGERHVNAKLSDDAVREILSSYRRGIGKALAEKYGVSQTLISMIVNHKRRTT